MIIVNKNSLFQGTRRPNLALFRICLGIILFWNALHTILFRPELFSEKLFHFPYVALPFIQPIADGFSYFLFGLMTIASVGFTLGYFYRLSTILYTIIFAYFFFLEESLYLNHYYALLLILICCSFLNLHSQYSLDKRYRGYDGLNPNWALWLLKTQIGVFYFFAGVAKINFDWLQGQPLIHLFSNYYTVPVIGPFLASDMGAYFFAYGGLIFDLSIFFLLLYGRTRGLAVILVVLFNVSNLLIFSNGMFPFMMIVALLIFIKKPFYQWPIIMRFFTESNVSLETSTLGLSVNQQFWIHRFLVVFLLFQTLFPLRHFLIPGNVSWTEEGHQFAWQQMPRNKQTRFAIVLKTDKGQACKVDYRRHLTQRQQSKMTRDPEMILRYAHFVKRRAQSSPYKDPKIYAWAFASLNGRRLQPFVDPKVDLAKEEFKLFGHYDWIVPLDKSIPIGIYPRKAPPAVRKLTKQLKKFPVCTL